MQALRRSERYHAGYTVVKDIVHDWQLCRYRAVGRLSSTTRVPAGDRRGRGELRERDARAGVSTPRDAPSSPKYNSDPIAIGFNPKYVVELLTQMTRDQVTVALGGELDPGLIRPLTGDDYLGMVMPMRI